MVLTVQQSDRITVIHSDQLLRCLTWAPYTPKGHPFSDVYTLVNATLGHDEFIEEPFEKYCEERLQQAQLESSTSVMLLTTVPQTHLKHRQMSLEQTGLEIDVFCTAGMGNALAPGDPALYNEEFTRQKRLRPGTINIMVIINRALTPAAMVEMIQIITMAKCQSLYLLQQKSHLSSRIALGTGTDNMVLAVLASDQQQPLRYSGLSTKLGEYVAKAVDSVLSCAVESQRMSLANKG
ncbi:adenosylcobinamide amidohydrolase [Candidatus Uhrbacteria bacterium]|nr:adenosylcobinamide amidohydrolase [Candidatus Uhrbacteria bacterium]